MCNCLAHKAASYFNKRELVKYLKVFYEFLIPFLPMFSAVPLAELEFWMQSSIINQTTLFV